MKKCSLRGSATYWPKLNPLYIFQSFKSQSKQKGYLDVLILSMRLGCSATEYNLINRNVFRLIKLTLVNSISLFTNLSMRW